MIGQNMESEKIDFIIEEDKSQTSSNIEESSDIQTKDIRIPLKRSLLNVNHIVGLTSIEISNNNDSKIANKSILPNSIPPPVILFCSFAKSQTTEEKFNDQLTVQEKDISVPLIKTLIASSEYEFNYLMFLFYQHVQEKKFCCDNSVEFWKWSSNSSFNTNGIRYDYTWLETMLNYLEFRETLRLWYMIMSYKYMRIFDVEENVININNPNTLILLRELKSYIKSLNDRLADDVSKGRRPFIGSSSFMGGKNSFMPKKGIRCPINKKTYKETDFSPLKRLFQSFPQLKPANQKKIRPGFFKLELVESSSTEGEEEEDDDEEEEEDEAEEEEIVEEN